MTPIRYDLISRAIQAYTDAGFTYLEVPWIVDPKAVNVTLPVGRTAYTTLGGALVGSAEQSFISLMTSGRMEPGNYIAASPCFRDDPPDDLHQATFFKVELITLQPIDREFGDYAVRKMAKIARNFMTSLPDAWGAQIVEHDEGLDIELNGIELGSYGYRRHGDWHWIYGTGLAEPRFSIATSQFASEPTTDTSPSRRPERRG